MLNSGGSDRFSQALENNIAALLEGDHKVLPWIFCVFSEKHAPSKVIASKALNDILNKLDFDDVVRIDAQMRQTTSMEWYIDWWKLKIEDFLVPAISVEERRAVLVFASYNPNGLIREQAVRLLADYAGTLPYIMLRQNDWAVQVRQAAAISFQKRLQNPSPGEILSALPYAEKLKWCCRGAPWEYTEQFFHKLTGAECREDLSRGLQSRLVRTRRICIQALFEAPALDLAKTFDHLKREPDPFLRQMIFERLRRLGQDMTECSVAFLRDRYTANRIAGLRFLRLTQKYRSLPFAQKMLLDQNAAVRDLARTIVREYTHDFNAEAFYSEQLENHTAAAILGLGETGSKQTAKMIERYLGDSRTAVVRAAMITLMRLDSGEYGGEIIERLGDDTGNIVKLARKLTLQYGTTAYHKVLETYHAARSEHGKINCMVVLFTASKWQRLIYMLEVLSCDMESVQNAARHSVAEWLYSYNRSFVAATEQQKETIRRRINDCRDRLPKSVQDQVLFCLG